MCDEIVLFSGAGGVRVAILGMRVPTISALLTMPLPPPLPPPKLKRQKQGARTSRRSRIEPRDPVAPDCVGSPVAQHPMTPSGLRAPSGVGSPNVAWPCGFCPSGSGPPSGFTRFPAFRRKRVRARRVRETFFYQCDTRAFGSGSEDLRRSQCVALHQAWSPAQKIHHASNQQRRRLLHRLRAVHVVVSCGSFSSSPRM